MNKPFPCTTCPLANIGRGFCLGRGNPARARLGVQAEAPGPQEIGWVVNDETLPGESTQRSKDYPNIPERFRHIGAPLIGPSGSLFTSWYLRPSGFDKVPVFLDNTLRCLPPKVKDSAYPTGETRVKAEAACRRYDRWEEFADGEDVVNIVTIHPANIIREITPLPLVTPIQQVPDFHSDLQKARDLVTQGFKVRLLMGGKAAESVLGYGSNVTKFRGHYTVTKGKR